MDLLHSIKSAVESVTGSENERKAYQATTNDNWPCTVQDLVDLALATYDWTCYTETTNIIWSHLHYLTSAAPTTQHTRWKQVYKTLLLLEQLLRHGNNQIIIDCRTHMTELYACAEMRVIEDQQQAFDKGAGIRKTAREIITWLTNPDTLKQIRQESEQYRKRYQAEEGGMYNRGGIEEGRRSSRDYGHMSSADMQMPSSAVMSSVSSSSSSSGGAPRKNSGWMYEPHQNNPIMPVFDGGRRHSATTLAPPPPQQYEGIRRHSATSLSTPPFQASNSPAMGYRTNTAPLPPHPVLHSNPPVSHTSATFSYDAPYPHLASQPKPVPNSNPSHFTPRPRAASQQLPVGTADGTHSFLTPQLKNSTIQTQTPSTTDLSFLMDSTAPSLSPPPHVSAGTAQSAFDFVNAR